MEIHEALATYKELYLFERDGYKVIFHPLLWQEFKNFRYLIRLYPTLRPELEDFIWEMGVIEHNFPAGMDYLDAGIVTTIAQLILYHSGCSFMSEADIGKANLYLDNARFTTQSIEGQIKLAICEAFPSYKPEDIDNLSWSQVVEKLAFSERLLKKDFSFNLKKDEVKDNSNKVFEMLNDYSANHGRGILEQEISENEVSSPRMPPKRQSR